MRPVPASPVLVPRSAAVAGLVALATMATFGCDAKDGPGFVEGTMDYTPAPATDDTGPVDTDRATVTGDTAPIPPLPGDTGDTGDTGRPGSGSYTGIVLPDPDPGTSWTPGPGGSGGSGR